MRAAPKDTLIIADGFSCREQIAQSTDRRALSLAEVLRMALDEQDEGSQGVAAGDYPERALANAHPAPRRSTRMPMTLAALAVAGGAAAVVATLIRARRAHSS